MTGLVRAELLKLRSTRMFYGNVLAATAMLHGLAAEEVGETKLDLRDRDFEVVIGVTARRPE